MVRVVDCHTGVLGSNPGGPKDFSLWKSQSHKETQTDFIKVRCLQGLQACSFFIRTILVWNSWVVSGLLGALYSICCLGVSTIMESEKIVKMWPTNDLIALTHKGSRGVGAQPPFFDKQNVKI